MSKIILLNKDSSISIIKEKKFKYNKNIQYVLIPIDSFDINNNFICLKANKYMEFDYAEIYMNTNLIYYDFEYVDDYSNVDTLEGGLIGTDSIIELYNYIHSLNKMEYINDITSSNLENTFQMNIDINIITIRLYKNKKCIFDYKYNLLDNIESQDFDSNYNMLDINLGEIFKDIDDIYHSALSNFSYQEYLTINTNKNRWKIEKNPIIKEGVIYGVVLYHSITIYFMDDIIYTKFLNISDGTWVLNLFLASYAGEIRIDYTNQDDIDEFLYNNPDCDYYDGIEIYLTKTEVLEYVIYLKYIYSVLRLMFEKYIGIMDFVLLSSIRRNETLTFDSSIFPDEYDIIECMERM